MHHRIVSTLLASSMLSVTAALRETAAAPPTAAAIEGAYRFLHHQHDRFHNSFLIYSNRDEAGSHFHPERWMGDIVNVNNRLADEIVNDGFDRLARPGQQRTVRIGYPKELVQTGEQKWMAIGWNIPKDSPDALPGYHLGRYCQDGEPVILRFWCRAEAGVASVEFKANSTDASVNPAMLGPKWQEKKFLMSPVSFSAPLHEFFVIAMNADNNPRGAAFLLDHVELEFGQDGQQERLSDPRFIRSYVPNGYDEPDWHFFASCYCYDQALAISALVARGNADDLRHAKLIADAFLYAQENDRRFHDGRLRNAYAFGDLAALGKNGLEGPTRLPGRWDYRQRKWFEDEYFSSTDVGNMSWIILGLLNYVDAPGSEIEAGDRAKSPYVAAAVKLAEWIDKNAFDTTGLAGFTGGVTGPEQEQSKLTWKSTEHAIDLYAAFSRLAEITGNARFRECAEHARSFVVGPMWDKKANHLWTGSDEDGASVNKKTIPLDIHPWSVLALQSESAELAKTLAWAEQHCRLATRDGTLRGYDFDDDCDGVWYEGTGQMAVAWLAAGDTSKSQDCLRAMRSALVSTGKEEFALHAATKDGLTTGFQNKWGDWVYYQRPHVGATCWYLLAEQGYNPYWGTRIAVEAPGAQ